MIWYYLDKNKLTKLNGSQNCDFKRNYLMKRKEKKNYRWNKEIETYSHEWFAIFASLNWLHFWQSLLPYVYIRCVILWSCTSQDRRHGNENMMNYDSTGVWAQWTCFGKFDYLYDLRLGINFRQYMFKVNYLFWQIEMVIEMRIMQQMC